MLGKFMLLQLFVSVLQAEMNKKESKTKPNVQDKFERKEIKQIQ